MLQTIREHTQGWIAGTIVTIIIMTFALWGIHSYFIGNASSNVVADVNGVEITREQLTVAYERMRRQAQNQYNSNNPLSVKDDVALKDRALKTLIEIETLKMGSINQGFTVSNRQIDNYLQSMPEFQVDGRFSLERFQELLASTMLSTSEFLDLIKTSLLIDQPKLGVVLTSFALPDETSYSIALVNQERNIDYINIPLQYFLSQPIVISPTKIQAYYDEHKNDFMTPEQVNLEFIQLSVNDLTSMINPTDLMLKNFYNENINSYTQPMAWKLIDIEIPVAANATQAELAQAKTKAEAALASIKKGEDFNKIAQQYTQGLAAQDWITLNQVPVEIQKAVAEISKPGQISDLIYTNKAIIIVKAVDVREPKIESFDVVKDKVKETYVRQHAEEKFADMRDRLADVTYEHPESLQLAAKSLGLPVNTSELFSKDKGGKDISQFKKVRDTAFSNDVMNLQNNSDVIQLNPESVVVIRVKSHIASALLPLSAVSKQIEDKLKAQEAESRAVKFTADLKASLQAGANPQQLATTNKLTWTQAGSIGRYTTKVDSAILDTAFRLPNPATNQNKPVYGVTRLPTGFAVIALKAVKDGSVGDDKQRSVFAEQVQNSEGLLEYELYKLNQMNNAKIAITK